MPKKPAVFLTISFSVDTISESAEFTGFPSGEKANKKAVPPEAFASLKNMPLSCSARTSVPFP